MVLEGVCTEVPLGAGGGPLSLFPDFLVHQGCFFTGLRGKFSHLADKPVEREKGQFCLWPRTLMEPLEQQLLNKLLCARAGE